MRVNMMTIVPTAYMCRERVVCLYWQMCMCVALFLAIVLQAREEGKTEAVDRSATIDKSTAAEGDVLLLTVKR